ncbi:MAG: ribosomal-processing cysteine protease Prp, partial [Lysinibacillus sp.]
MTKVNVVKDIDLIKSIEVYDHAGFAGHGDDIVCAGISTIIFGGLNALIEFGLSEECVEISEATINI